MTIEENKALVQRFIEEVFGKGNTDAIAEFTVPGSMLAGGAEGNKVAVRMTTQGTNSGPLVGLPAFGRLENPVPPTGKTVMHTGVYIFKLSKGKIVSYSLDMDQIGMLRQLGWTFTPPG